MISIIGFYIVYILYSIFICAYGCTIYCMHDTSWNYLTEFVKELYCHDCIPMLAYANNIIPPCFISIFIWSITTATRSLTNLQELMAIIFVIIFPLMLASSNLYWNEDLLTSPQGSGGTDRSIEVFYELQKLIYSDSSLPTDEWRYSTFLLIPIGLYFILMTRLSSLNAANLFQLIQISFYGFFIMLIPIIYASTAIGIATTVFESIPILKYTLLHTIYFLSRYGIFYIWYSTFILSLLYIFLLHSWILKHNIIVQITLGIIMTIAIFFLN